MEYMGIINQEIDMADKYRVWVKIDEGEAVMLKFQGEPTEQQIIDATNLYIYNIENPPELPPEE
jgi:hypothetical protein